MRADDINNLPHLPPVCFIKEVLHSGEIESSSMVEFQEEPTLSATVEAAAQNVIFIASLYKDYDGGVLTGMKKVELLRPLSKGSYKVESKILAQLNNFSIFTFRLSQDDNVFVEGEINIVMKDRDEKL